MDNISKNLPVLLCWSLLLLIPFSRLAELPGLIMGIGVLVLLARGKIDLVDSRHRLFTIAFAAIWLPMLLSLPDAYDPGNSMRTTFSYLRHFFAGHFVIWALRERRSADLFLALSAALIGFWVIDGAIQLVIGIDLLGLERSPDRLNGIFGKRGIKFGPVLSVLAALPLCFAAARLPRLAALLFALITLFVVFAAGSRAGWLMIVIALVACTVAHMHTVQLKKPAMAALLLLAAAVPAVGYLSLDSVATRVDRTLHLLSGDAKSIDHALSFRLPIWHHALEMSVDHPVNGIGARSFRSAYREYGTPGDRYMSMDMMPTHAHQIFLEVTSETGLFGLLGLSLLYVLLIRAWRHAATPTRRQAMPVAIALFAALFPINTHLALFSSFWGQILWFLIALFFATVGGDEPAATTPRSTQERPAASHQD